MRKNVSGACREWRHFTRNCRRCVYEHALPRRLLGFDFSGPLSRQKCVTRGVIMDTKSFFKSGHFPTLMAAFLYFDVSFMVWVLLGPLAPFLGEQMHLTATQKGLLTAIPLLGGSLFRPVLGVLGDRLGGRNAGLLGLCLTLVPLHLA